MIKKLRLKFVGVCMLLVTAVLAVVFLSVYTASEHNIERASKAVLERVIYEDSVATLPGDDTKPSFSLGTGKVQLPYFTVQIWNGTTAYITGGNYDDLENTETLSAILQSCMDQSAAVGTISDYGLRYLRQDNGLYTQIAFVDTSMEQATLKSMMASYLQIGLAALFLLLGVSFLLSYWVTKPVEKAWTQQRQFLSDASHELKTPLTVILSNAELMESAPLPGKAARWADNISSEASRMKTLVEEMLTLARADNMVRTSVYSQVSLSDVADDCALSFEPVAFESGKPLEYDIPEGICVTGDGEKLRQVLSVLLDNAIKYGADGATIRMTLQRQEKHARLLVENRNAAGPIPPEQLSRLFERFYRADASRGEKSGFGLGLPIAATIAAEHKGTLKAESDDTSTRFILTLPLKK
ncbi:MAG: HAMP domain-containing histidine kinase [Oscillibacter sp.]|nr:HAMP domain-containing histidine kinase [Oscillibacter sp.]